MTTEQQATFLSFDDFESGAMVKECRCDGIMQKQRVRMFPEIPAVIDVGVCQRCGELWDGRID
jgi:hypothetical protein